MRGLEISVSIIVRIMADAASIRTYAASVGHDRDRCVRPDGSGSLNPKMTRETQRLAAKHKQPGVI